MIRRRGSRTLNAKVGEGRGSELLHSLRLWHRLHFRRSKCIRARAVAQRAKVSMGNRRNHAYRRKKYPGRAAAGDLCERVQSDRYGSYDEQEAAGLSEATMPLRRHRESVRPECTSQMDLLSLGASRPDGAGLSGIRSVVEDCGAVIFCRSL